MARVLHVVTGGDADLASTMIRRDLEAGDQVAVALLADSPAPTALPDHADTHRVPADWSYEELLEQIFAADRVTTW